MDDENNNLSTLNNPQNNLSYNNHQIDSTLIKMILNVIQDGDLNNIKSNLEKYHIDLKYVITENGQNAFFYTAFIKKDEDSFNVCKYLNEIGIDPFCKDKLKQTCIYYTVRENKYLTTKYLIEECKLPINEKDIYGQTPIYYCCREGHLKLCELLLEKGANINNDDNYEQNCLFYAIREGHYEIVNYLIEKGININKIDKGKLSPALYAKKMNQIKIFDLLVEKGAVLPENNKLKNKKNEKGRKKIKKSPEEEELNKKEYIDEIQKPKKFFIVKITDSGEKIRLTHEEILSFYKNNPEIENLLKNKEELNNKLSTVNEELKMYDNWEKIAKKLLTILSKSKGAELFLKPVDPEELGIPDYFEKIKHPMDFSTIKKKLIHFSYTNFKEFCDDINLVFENCYLYNGKETYVGNICTNVKNEYIKLYEQFDMNKFI